MVTSAHNPLYPIRPSPDIKPCQIAKKSFSLGNISDTDETVPTRHEKLSICLAFVREKKFPFIDNHLSIIFPLEEFASRPSVKCALIPTSTLPCFDAEPASRPPLPAPRSTRISNKTRFCWTKNISVHNNNPTKPQFVSITRHNRRDTRILDQYTGAR